MYTRLSIVLILLMLWAGPGMRAQTEGWQAHTPMRLVRDLGTGPGVVWAATTGGVFRYDTGSEEIRRFTTVEGLSDINAQAVAYDADRDVVWVGYASGVIDRIDGDGGVQAFRDIARADQFLARGVNGFTVHGDTLFVMTDFGLVVFDPVGLEVRDAYTQFGSIEAATPVRDAQILSGGRRRTSVSRMPRSRRSTCASRPSGHTSPAFRSRPRRRLRPSTGRLWSGRRRTATSARPGGPGRRRTFPAMPSTIC